MAIAEPIAAVPSARRWFHLTPGRLLVVLLAVEGGLLLPEPWFPKGWAVLIAVAAVGVFLLVMLLWLAVAIFFGRRFQFSIRSLMLLTVAVAVPFSWFAAEIKWAREQREAVEAILKAGGWIKYDSKQLNPRNVPMIKWIQNQLGEDFFYRVVFVSTSGPILPRLKSLPDTIDLELIGSSVSDEGLKHLHNLANLQQLTLRGTNNTDAGLETLSNFKQIIKIDVGCTKIKGAGLVYLWHLPAIKELNLNYTAITDSEMKNLAAMHQLQVIHLEGNSITDDGLEHLYGLTHLQNLYLMETKVSKNGVKKLNQALPNCVIDWANTDGWHVFTFVSSRFP